MRLLNAINLIRSKVADLRTGVLVWGFALGMLSIGALWAAIAYDVHTSRAQVLRDQVAQILVETGVVSQFEI